VLTFQRFQAFYPFPEKQDATRLAHCARLLAFAARGRDGGDLIQDTARVQQNITVVARVRLSVWCGVAVQSGVYFRDAYSLLLCSM